MATGDIFATVRPTELARANAPDGWISQLQAVGAGMRGVPLRKLDTDDMYFLFRVPINGTPVATGITVEFMLDESARPGEQSAGSAVVIEVQVKKIVSGTDDETETGTGTAEKATVTMNATTGIVTVGSIAVTTAQADNIAAGSWVLVQLRRIGSDAADTHPHSVILLGLTIKDT